MLERTVTFRFPPEEHFGQVENLRHPNVQIAIGYLVTWGLSSNRFKVVAISGDARGELTATYYREDGEVGFVMGGVRDPKDGSYSFHS